jgi:hypothetical protein
LRERVVLKYLLRIFLLCLASSLAHPLYIVDIKIITTRTFFIHKIFIFLNITGAWTP